MLFPELLADLNVKFPQYTCKWADRFFLQGFQPDESIRWKEKDGIMQTNCGWNPGHKQFINIYSLNQFIWAYMQICGVVFFYIHEYAVFLWGATVNKQPWEHESGQRHHRRFPLIGLNISCSFNWAPSGWRRMKTRERHIQCRYNVCKVTLSFPDKMFSGSN